MEVVVIETSVLWNLHEQVQKNFMSMHKIGSWKCKIMYDRHLSYYDMPCVIFCSFDSYVSNYLLTLKINTRNSYSQLELDEELKWNERRSRKTNFFSTKDEAGHFLMKKVSKVLKLLHKKQKPEEDD
uniref:Uncharacterized protein n=1 Tax=Cucumis melo TaxID=3656 RepID=A0A9I9E998_CUCME